MAERWIDVPEDRSWEELALVRRSGVAESHHLGTVVALDSAGDVALALGTPDAVVLPRSTTKPLQALACLRAGAPLEGPALAIAAGSHTGQDEHVEVVRSILARAGLGEDALGCPVDWPQDEATRDRLVRDGDQRSRVRMNCSGKHAAMLLACTVNGWPTETYLAPEHPLQDLVRSTTAELTGVPVERVAVDGCGAPLFSTTVTGLARAFRALAVAAPGTDEAEVARAMRDHPFYVGGTGQTNTDTMRALPGTVAKGGAEGVIGMATAAGQAVGVKVVDGNPRATTVIALAALEGVGVDVSSASALRQVDVLGGGSRVGSVEVSGSLLAWHSERVGVVR